MPAQRMCVYDGCDVKNPPIIDRKLFRFPKDPAYRKEWLQKCSKLFQTTVSETSKSLNSSYYNMCSKHFVATDYINPLTHGKLRSTAIPKDKIVVQSLAKFHNPAAWYEKISYELDVPTNDNIKIEEEPLIPESPTFGNDDGILFPDSPTFGNDDGITVPDSISVMNGLNLKIVNVFSKCIDPSLFGLPSVQTPEQSAHKSINTHVSSCEPKLEDSGASNIQSSCVAKKGIVRRKYLRRDMIIKKKRITFNDIIKRVVDSGKISPFLCMLLSHELLRSKARRARFNQELLDMCHRLFKSSRPTYLILKELVPSLPSTKTMKRMNIKMSQEPQNTDGIQVNDTDVG